MKMKKIVAVIGAMALALSIGTTAFATAATQDDNSIVYRRQERPALTEEQKAEMEAKRAEFKAKRDAQIEKWNALTDAQKEEIYGLKDKASDAESQIIDKYKEWGILDEETANDIKTRITDGKTKMREDARMPGFGRGFDDRKKVPKLDNTL